VRNAKTADKHIRRGVADLDVVVRQGENALSPTEPVNLKTAVGSPVVEPSPSGASI